LSTVRVNPVGDSVDLLALFQSQHKPTLHHLMAMQMKCLIIIHNYVCNHKWPLKKSFVFRLFTA